MTFYVTRSYGLPHAVGTERIRKLALKLFLFDIQTGRSFRRKTKFHAVVSHGRGKRVQNRIETPSQQIFKKDYIYRGTFRHNRISGVMTALVIRGISKREELKGLKFPQNFRKITNLYLKSVVYLSVCQLEPIM